MSVSRKILFLLPMLLLSACGYHLQGAYHVPNELKTAYLEGGTLPLREQLLKTVHPTDGHFAFDPTQSKLIIRILNENNDSRVLSLNEQGRTNERELLYQLDYELAHPDNSLLLERQSLEIKREFFFNQQDIIAKDNEEKVIRNEMYQQAAASIINRARVVLEADRP